MSLSPAEIVSIVVGLAGGFWLVSRIMDGKNAPDLTPEDFGRPNPNSTQHERPEGSPRPDAPRSLPWWEVLGVPRIATRDEVARAYKRKISEYHPDKVAQMGEEIRAVAERKSKEINAAYDEAMGRF